jgi:hypothetical protein
MTDQERQLLEELAGRIQKAPVSQVDRDADELIRRSIGARPDALYILTQTVLIQEMALNQAKQQIDELKRQQPPASFLGNTAPTGGTGYGRTSGTEPRVQPPSGYRASSYQTGYVPPAPPPTAAPAPPPLPQYAQPQYAPPLYVQPQSGFSSFLQNAAQTAAGVVAGEVAFSAISSLFGHHGGYGGYGGFGGSGFLGGGGGSMISPVSETIINNNTYNDTNNYNDTNTYNDENRGSEHGDRSSGSDRFAGDADNDAGDYTSEDSTDDNTTDDDTTDDDTDDSSSYDSGSDSSDS